MMDKMPKLLQHILNPDSRKVGFGWCLFIVSNAFLFYSKIDSDMWQINAMLSAALIGGGTLADSWIEKVASIKAGAKTAAAATAQAPQEPAK